MKLAKRSKRYKAKDEHAITLVTEPARIQLSSKHTSAFPLNPHHLQPIGISGFAALGLLFNGHIFEFGGFEYLSAFQAFDKFGIFFSGHDLDARVLTLIHVPSLCGDWRREYIS
ncbi:MAG TPA: hypothetical protein VFA89_04985 [Terriglobales bacterium]|nr:hypothetical protein [Terriglobales bacterium]